jgi:hypothetical protein
MHWPIHPKLCGILDQPFEVHIVKKERDVPAGTKSRGFSLIREHAEGCSKAILSETETPKVGLHDTVFFFTVLVRVFSFFVSVRLCWPLQVNEFSGLLETIQEARAVCFTAPRTLHRHKDGRVCFTHLRYD